MESADGALTLAQFARLIKSTGGEVVGFGDPSTGMFLDQEDIEAMVKEEENGRSPE